MAGGGTGYLGKAAVNVPLGDNAAIRFVGAYEHIPGYVDRAVPGDWFEADPDLAISEREVNDAELLSGRILGMVEIDDNVKITPSIWYSEIDAGGSLRVLHEPAEVHDGRHLSRRPRKARR